MKIRHGKSLQFSRKCVVCETPTSGYKIYEEGGISIRVSVCHRDKSDCHQKITVKDKATVMVRGLKRDIEEVLS